MKDPNNNNDEVEIETLGDFELLEELGKGEMGEVYKARQISVDRLVAIKVLHSNLARNPAYIDRFRREMRVVASLNHPNIVQFYAAGADHGFHYYAMEFVDGESFRDRVEREKKLPIEEAISAILQAVYGLQHGWEKKNIVHRDIKPANLLLNSDGILKIADLGLAKPASGDYTLTVGPKAMGTPQYVSPEQVAGQTDLDFRTDIYSLGATLYHMLTGAVPFDGNSAMEILTKHITATLPDPRQHDPTMPPQVVAVINRMMSKERSDRHATYQELKDELRSLIS